MNYIKISFLCFVALISSCKKGDDKVTKFTPPPVVVEPPVVNSLEGRKININLSAPAQFIDMIGGDMERSQSFLMKAANTDDIVKWCFNDIKFAVCRVSYDKKQELVEGTKNFAFYNDAISSMKKIKLANPNIKFWCTAKTDYTGYGVENNLPDWIYTGQGYNGGSYDASKLNTTKYAKFLADYLKLMSNNGVAISYMSVMKEWQSVLTADNENATITKLKALLNTTEFNGVSLPEFIGPSSWGVSQSSNFISQVITKSYQNNYKGFASHSYDLPDITKWQTLVNLGKSVNKSVWHGESSSGSNGRTNGAEPPIEGTISMYNSRKDMYDAGINGEVFFELWSRGIAEETRAVYFTNNGTAKRMRGYYIMRDFANQVLGTNYLPTTTTATRVQTMAFRKDKDLYLMVTNISDSLYTKLNITIDNNVQLVDNTFSKLEFKSNFAAEGNSSQINKKDNQTIETDILPKSISTFKLKLK